MKDQSILPAETSEVSLRLERYTDIFSDFDIRPFSKRALSFDFLEELKRAIYDNTQGEVEIVLHIPEKERKEYEEEIIKERLAAHFKRQFHLLRAQKQRILKLGISMVVMGIVCMIVATFIIFKDPSENMFLSFLVVFLEPAAWFLLWEGADQIIFNSKNINPDLNFYRKISDAHKRIHFKSY
jgi:hypothetical protein